MSHSQAPAAHFALYPSLRHRVVVITGGATGIGQSMVEEFARQHAQVAFLDIRNEEGRSLVQRLSTSGAVAPAFYPCDLQDISALQAAVAAILHTHGTVDVLINNAANDARHHLGEVTPASWDQVIAQNLKHQFFMCQAVLPAMRAAGHGSILNMSSIAWRIPSADIPVYNTAKAAVVGLTRTLAHEAGRDNIRVNCILPGAILTERQLQTVLTPAYQAEVLAAQALKRMILPAEVARLALFLAADDSSAITGQSYTIDAGWT